MTGARYGALGVLTEDGSALAEFITVGLEPDQVERLGAHPTGRGVLGTLITDPQPLRVRELSSHPDSFGFPAGHPPMTSFLGVPIKVRDAIYGNLYLTDKVGWAEFTSDDEALIGALAVAAGRGDRKRTPPSPRPAGGGVRRARPARQRFARHGHPAPVCGRTLSPGYRRKCQGPRGVRPDTNGRRRSRRHHPPAPLGHLRAGPGRQRTGFALQRDLAAPGTSSRGGLRRSLIFRWTGGRERPGPGGRTSLGRRPRGSHQYRTPCPGHPGRGSAPGGQRRMPP